MKPEQNAPVFDHTGHRRRMLEEFRRGGLEVFTDVEVLEFLLSYAIPRRDVNPLARILLREFGDLHQVFNASQEALMKVPGIGLRTAALLRCCGDLWSRCERSRLSSTVYLRTMADAGRYLISVADGLREERAWLLNLDAKRKLIARRELGAGSVTSVNLPCRRVVEAALMNNASSVILGHNHVSGALIPSLEDLEYTRSLARTLNAVDVVLADHIIVGQHNYFSMKSGGMLEGLL